MSEQHGAKESDDWVANGFHRLDEKLISGKPPKIAWGLIYKHWPTDDKVLYLEKLAATMNHAAFLIQNERNDLGHLCEAKEARLVQMTATLDANTSMIQDQLTKMNEDRQGFNRTIAGLNAKVRELQHGDNS